MAELELEQVDYAGPIPDGKIFPAEVLSVKIVDSRFVDEQTQKPEKRVEFKFVIEDETNTWDGQNIWGTTPVRFNTHPDCKLKNWAQEIMATEFPAGYKLDTDILVGQKCRIYVTAKDGKDKEGKDKVYNNVGDVMRSRDAVAENPF